MPPLSAPSGCPLPLPPPPSLPLRVTLVRWRQVSGSEVLMQLLSGGTSLFKSSPTLSHTFTSSLSPSLSLLQLHYLLNFRCLDGKINPAPCVLKLNKLVSLSACVKNRVTRMYDEKSMRSWEHQSGFHRDARWTPQKKEKEIFISIKWLGRINCTSFASRWQYSQRTLTWP